MIDHGEFHLDRVGSWSEEVEFHADRDRMVAYAEATNDPIRDHLEGRYAPPVFAVVPAMNVMADTTMGVVPDELMLRILHGEHDFRFHRPILPGETLRVRAKPVGVEGKSSGVVVTTKIETRGQKDDDLVNEQYFVGFFRGGHFEGLSGEPAPDHTADPATFDSAPAFTVNQRIDEDQTFRYAEPAGDPMPIHLDDDFAKQMGLPGIIVHGLCTIAFASHALINRVSPDDPTRLSRLAVRMASPCRPGETISTSAWNSGDAPGRYAFTTARTDEPGAFALTDGLAEFASKEK